MNPNSNELVYSQKDLDLVDEMHFDECLELREQLIVAEAKIALLEQQLKRRSLH